MTTETKQKKIPKEAAKKGLFIGAKVALFVAIVNVAIIFMQPSLPACDSEDATIAASLRLNATDWMRASDLRVVSIHEPELIASNEAGDILGCSATMNATGGQSFPIVYRIEWEDESEGVFLVNADLDR